MNVLYRFSVISSICIHCLDLIPLKLRHFSSKIVDGNLHGLNVAHGSKSRRDCPLTPPPLD
jgi:hypothetical protein